MKPLTVLVADDEENILVLIEHWLAQLGYKVVTVKNATEAKSVCEHQAFDLVVTDVLMPGGDGIDLIESVKKSRPTGRILAISGGGRYLDRDECLKIARGLGAHAVLMKPFTREQFLAGVARAMRPPRGDADPSI
ncbi:MAG: response regulator [Opitutaceae bacterium]|nr:response regulator [Opitutaceae bacterium]